MGPRMKDLDLVSSSQGLLLSRPQAIRPTALPPCSRSLGEWESSAFWMFQSIDFQEAFEYFWFFFFFLSSSSFCLPQGEDDKRIIGRLHSSAN